MRKVCPNCNYSIEDSDFLFCDECGTPLIIVANAKKNASEYESITEIDVLNSDVSENDVSENDVLENDVLENNVSENDVPESDVLESDVLENDVQESDVLENDVPESDVPESDVPESDVPESDVPENDVPENDVPENDAPENDIPESNTMDLYDNIAKNKNENLTIIKVLVGVGLFFLFLWGWSEYIQNKKSLSLLQNKLPSLYVKTSEFYGTNKYGQEKIYRPFKYGKLKYLCCDYEVVCLDGSLESSGPNNYNKEIVIQIIRAKDDNTELVKKSNNIHFGWGTESGYSYEPGWYIVQWKYNNTVIHEKTFYVNP